MTQHQKIMDYLRTHDSISPYEAFVNLRITKLSTRIGEIERTTFYTFKRTRVTERTDDGETVTYMRYKLEQS